MEQGNNLAERFRALTIIYIALGAGMVISIALFYFMLASGTAVGLDAGTSDILKIVVVVIAMSGFGAGKFIYGMNAKKSQELTDPVAKFNSFQTTCIITWALLEGPGIFASVAYFMSGDSIFLAFFSMIFLGYIFNKPTVAKFQQDF